jgi:hypothetical protein
MDVSRLKEIVDFLIESEEQARATSDRMESSGRLKLLAKTKAWSISRASIRSANALTFKALLAASPATWQV